MSHARIILVVKFNHDIAPKGRVNLIEFRFINIYVLLELISWFGSYDLRIARRPIKFECANYHSFRQK